MRPCPEEWSAWSPTRDGDRIGRETTVGYGVAMQERVKKSVSAERESETDAVETDTSAGSRLRTELDDLLDDIDQVLEENAEEFVKNYVQKGGQ